MADFEFEPKPEYTVGGKNGKNISQTPHYDPPVPLPKRGVGNPGLAKKKLNENVDEIIEDLLKGLTFIELAVKYDVSLTSVFSWRYKSEYCKLVEEAMLWTSEMDQQKAERVLIEGEGKTLPEIIRRKELSVFYRWRASKRAPKVFGNNSETNVNVNVQTLDGGEFNELVEQIVRKKQIAQATEDAEIIEDDPAAGEPISPDTGIDLGSTEGYSEESGWEES